MNLTRAAAVALASEIASKASSVPHVELAVCPPSVYLEAVGTALQGRAARNGRRLGGAEHVPRGGRGFHR